MKRKQQRKAKKNDQKKTRKTNEQRKRNVFGFLETLKAKKNLKKHNRNIFGIFVFSQRRQREAEIKDFQSFNKEAIK